MAGIHTSYEGADFNTVRAAVCATYFLHEDMSQEAWNEALHFVVPMQHNYENPIEPGTQDTWIQYWINDDDRLTQDRFEGEENRAMKVARVTLRFLGVQAEQWAKAFHHLTKRKSVAAYFQEYCNASMLEYVSPIVPINVDYFGVGNTTIAFDLSFNLQYDESIKLDWRPLDVLTLPPGRLVTGGIEP